MINIDELMLNAAKNKQYSKRESYKMIKAKFQEWYTDKKNIGKTMDEVTQVGILKKLRDEYTEDSKMYRNKMSGKDIADQYESYAVYINELIPAPVESSAIAYYAATLLATNPYIKIGDFIRKVQNEFLGNDGKEISEIVREVIANNKL